MKAKRGACRRFLNADCWCACSNSCIQADKEEFGMNNRKYSLASIKKAQELFKKGMSFVKISKECGFKSVTPVQYHCKPVYKEAQLKRTRDWQAKNPERWKEIANRASKKFYDKNRGK